MKKKAENVAYLAVFLALALLFSYVEALLPLPFAVPGMKLGLPNLVIVVCLYLFGPLPALLINIVRVLLVSLLFTNIYSLIFSLFGAAFSFAVMLLFCRGFHGSPLVTSVFGGIAHNAGQLLAAALFLQTIDIVYYLPALLLAGFVTGFLIGLLARLILPRLSILLHRARTDV